MNKAHVKINFDIQDISGHDLENLLKMVVDKIKFDLDIESNYLVTNLWTEVNESN